MMPQLRFAGATTGPDDRMYDFCMWTEESIWLLGSPSDVARRTCLYLEEGGKVRSIAPFFLQRENLGSYMLLYTSSGEGRLVYDGHILSLVPGQLLWIDVNEYHRLSANGMGYWDFLYLFVNGAMLPAMYALFAATGNPVRTIPEDSPILASMEAILHRQSPICLRDELRESACITSLLTDILALGEPEKPPYPIPEIQARFDTDYADHFSLQGLSDTYHINKFQLVKLFTQHVGMPPMSYLIRARVMAAQKLLRFTDDSVGSIALQVGADSAAHLIRMFNGRLGLTPGEYRKQWRCKASKLRTSG